MKSQKILILRYDELNLDFHLICRLKRIQEQNDLCLTHLFISWFGLKVKI